MNLLQAPAAPRRRPPTPAPSTVSHSAAQSRRPSVPAPPQPVARIAAVAVHLPERVVDVAEAERALARRNPAVVPSQPIVSRMTGVRRVRVMADDENASDLAVAAVRALGEPAERDVDLLIFASASQDMVEPATSHIVAAKLGLTVPVMDVKNACNSVLNALEVAEALIARGRYRRVLIACGEGPSRAVRWDVPDRATYALSAAGYTMSDAGAALLIEAAGAGSIPDAVPAGLDRVASPGILASVFSADSSHWDIGMLPAGGTAHPRDLDRAYFEIDGGRLREAFLALGPHTVHAALEQAGLTWDDVAVVAVHQVALAYLDDVHAALGLPSGRTIVTIDDVGNVASASLPLQLARAERSGRLRPGDVAVLVGLAGGISIGATVVRW